MRSSRSILNAFFVLAIALALVPVAQASIYAMADGVNFNALARQKAQKRAQHHHYRDLVRNPFRLFKRQEPDPGTPIPTPTDMPISNTSTTTTDIDTTSSVTTLEPTDLSTTSTDAEPTTEPSETETSTTDGIPATPSSSTDLPAPTDVTTTSEAPAPTTDDATSSTDAPIDETTTTDLPESTTTDEPPTETSTEIESSTEVTTSTEETTTTIRTTLDTTVKSAFTTAWSTSTFTLPNGSVGTVTEFLVVVPTMPPTRTQNPQETDSATGTASLHTNGAAGSLCTPGPAAPMVALVAVLGYVAF